MSISLVTHGMIGGVGTGSSLPQGPATVIAGPGGVDVDEFVPDPSQVSGAALYPDTVAVSDPTLKPDSVSVSSDPLVPTPIQVGTYRPQPINVEEEE